MTATMRTAFREGLLRDRVVLVTGGGTGIGRAIAHEVAVLDGLAVIVGRRESLLDATADEIRSNGGRADYLTCDVRDPEAVSSMVEAVVDRHGLVNGLVNNAGGQFPALSENISSNGWRAVVDLNLNAVFNVTRAVHDHHMGDHGGSIVSITANMFNGMPFMAHSGAARAGVVNLTKTLAIEWAPKGIRINAVAPGVIASSGMESYDPAVYQTIVEQAESAPAARFGTVGEVSAAVVFLLSDAAAFVTGQTLAVDGAASLLPSPLAPLPTGDPLPTY